MEKKEIIDRKWDAIIVGGGAAGLSAALMLGRSLRSTLVIDAGQPRNRFADRMHGVLGHDEKNPAELLRIGRRDAARYGVEFLAGEVRRVEEQPGGLSVVLADGARTSARTLIAASGVRDELPEIPGLAKRWGGTVLHCPYCHGWEMRAKRIGVLCTSARGIHLAQLARQLSPHVTVWVAPDDALPADVEAAFRARDVRVFRHAPTCVEEGESDALDVVDASGSSVTVDALFVASRTQPLDGYLADLALDRVETPAGSILKVDGFGTTSNPRVFAVGNIVGPQMTVPIASGGGTLAGITANAQLAEEDFARAVAGK